MPSGTLFSTMARQDNKKHSFVKAIENAKAQVYGGAVSSEVVKSLSSQSEKVPDFVYSVLIDTYLNQNQSGEALNVLIAVY